MIQLDKLLDLRVVRDGGTRTWVELHFYEVIGPCSVVICSQAVNQLWGLRKRGRGSRVITYNGRKSLA